MNMGTRLFLEYGLVPALAGAAVGRATMRLRQRFHRGLGVGVVVVLGVMVVSLVTSFGVVGNPWPGFLWVLGILIAFLAMMLVRNLSLIAKP
jgi:hypothetical protein